ncbi:MAG: preprotein translocase subunit SecG [Gammaproteobacteria bacterium]|nr:preprotein translocase subunit SecG [Gammaproteobacteria bacterium]
MESLQTILLVAQVLIAISLIGLILIQHGKGADAGAAFGSGASSTVFGSQGSGNFLTKATAILAFLFLANSLSLAFIASKRMTAQESLMIGSEIQIEQAAEESANDMEMEVPTVDMDMSEMMQEEIPQIPGTADDMPAIPDSDIPALPTE